MSNNTSIEGFFAEAAKNPELQQRISAIFVEAQRHAAESLAELSRQTTSPFTAEDYLAPADASTKELSDENLSEVAGGFNAWDAGGAAAGFLATAFLGAKAKALSNGAVKVMQYVKNTAPVVVPLTTIGGHNVGKVVDAARS